MIKKTTLILLYLSIFCFGLSAQIDANVEVVASEMPYFSGCETHADYSDEKRNCSNQSLIDFISRNLVFPEQAQSDDIEGTVYVRFTVSRSGKVINAKVLNHIGGGCDEEALRVVNMFPNWSPAQNDLGPLAVEMDLPILFALKTVEPIFSERHTIHWGTLAGKQTTRTDLLNNVKEAVIVRDEFGNNLDVSSLVIAYQRNRTFSDAESTGAINNEMIKVLKKAKAGGEVLLTTTIVEDGEFVEVARLYKIVE